MVGRVETKMVRNDEHGWYDVGGGRANCVCGAKGVWTKGWKVKVIAQGSNIHMKKRKDITEISL